MLRLMLLFAASLPILFGSMTLADWAREDPNARAERNTVRLCARIKAADRGCFGERRVRPAFIAAPSERALKKACQDVADRWKDRLPADHEIRIRTPYVLAGNVSARVLHTSYRRTIAPATEALQRAYFERCPDQPVTLLLFKDEASYRASARNLFGQQNVSVYGYYKPSTRTIVINLAAGDGTLVHELTHALVDFDFPEIPIWLNEGIASLYEQCQVDLDQAGPRIASLLNWRLSVLHDAMVDGKLGSIRELANSTHFRGTDEAIKYAHARYFCMFLEHRGLLDDYYQLLRANQHRDPLGIETLSLLFERQALEQVDREFRSWAFGLQLAER